MSIAQLIAGGVPLMPVLTCDEPIHIAARRDEFAHAGILAVEVTLRTPDARAVIDGAAGHPVVPVGAGTVLTDTQLDDSMKAGAAFADGPGYDGRLVARAAQNNLPYLPAVATSTEVLRAYRDGVREVMVFPAALSGVRDSSKPWRRSIRQCASFPRAESPSTMRLTTSRYPTSPLVGVLGWVAGMASNARFLPRTCAPPGQCSHCAQLPFPTRKRTGTRSVEIPRTETSQPTKTRRHPC